MSRSASPIRNWDGLLAISPRRIPDLDEDEEFKYAKKLEVGMRVFLLSIKDDDNYDQLTFTAGVIRYIGDVHYDHRKRKDWIGVDLDLNKGKHDGEIKGKKYFNTNFPKSGMMVRPRRVLKIPGHINVLSPESTENSLLHSRTLASQQEEMKTVKAEKTALETRILVLKKTMQHLRDRNEDLQSKLDLANAKVLKSVSDKNLIFRLKAEVASLEKQLFQTTGKSATYNSKQMPAYSDSRNHDSSKSADEEEYHGRERSTSPIRVKSDSPLKIRLNNRTVLKEQDSSVSLQIQLDKRNRQLEEKEKEILNLKAEIKCLHRKPPLYPGTGTPPHTPPRQEIATNISNNLEKGEGGAQRSSPYTAEGGTQTEGPPTNPLMFGSGESERAVGEFTEELGGSGLDETAAKANKTRALLQIPDGKKCMLDSGRVVSSACIPDTKIVDGVAYYEIIAKVDLGRTQERWSISRRFRDFDIMHQALIHSSSRNITDLVLPSKIFKLFFSHTSPGFIEGRRKKLEKYLKILLGKKELMTHIAVKDFFNEDAELIDTLIRDGDGNVMHIIASP